MNKKATSVYCQSCGTELASTFNVCPSCGSRDFGPTPPSVGASNTGPTATPTSSTSRLSSTRSSTTSGPAKVFPSAAIPTPVGSGSEPTKLRYIAVWFLATFLASLAGKITDLAFAHVFPPSDKNDLFFVLSPTVVSVAMIVVFTGVYLAFDSLKISKVVPWVVGSMALNVGATFFFIAKLERLGAEFPMVFKGTVILTAIATTYFFYWYFKTKQPHRY